MAAGSARAAHGPGGDRPGRAIGAGAQVKEALVLPGGGSPDGAILARGIAGDAARLAAGDW